jgi:hypothetical protein
MTDAEHIAHLRNSIEAELQKARTALSDVEVYRELLKPFQSRCAHIHRNVHSELGWDCLDCGYDTSQSAGRVVGEWTAEF